MTLPSLDDYRWLTSPTAQAALADAALGPLGSVALVTRLRKTLSPARAALVAEQAALRERATAKFPLAAQMFFTSRSLEQATDAVVAAHKAERFPPGARVADLCCGIGGDLMALAARAAVVGVDRDPAMVALAESNLALVAEREGERESATFAAQALPDASSGADSAALGDSGVRVDDASPDWVREADCWHIDPDRRASGSRVSRVELGEPGLETIESLLAANPRGAIKLSPAAEAPEDWASRAELEWISRGGECRQLVAWFGSLAKSPGERRATVIRGRGSELRIRSLTGSGTLPADVADGIGPFVFEPDAAVLAAELGGALAKEHGLGSLVPNGAYLTGPQAISDPALACFAVDVAVPYHARRVKSLLAERGIGRLEVKQRGVGLDPATVARELATRGAERATLLLARIGRQVMAIIARRTP